MALKIGSLFTPVSRTVGITATKLGAGTDGAPNTGRQSLLVHNNGSVTVFLGNASVTTALGIPLGPGLNLPFEMTDKCNLYGIVASGSADVRVLEAK